MAFRTRYEFSSDIGVYSKLTNSYCLVGQASSENFYSSIQKELGNHIPIIHTTIADTNIIGRMVAGNKKGLLVPSNITDIELKNLRNSLPDSVKIRKMDDRLLSLGNCISCNDFVALIHPEFDKESEELISDILGIEVFKTTIAGNGLVGTYSSFDNKGGIVHPATSMEEFEELANIMQLPIGAGTVNRGSEQIGSGIIVNDWIAFCGQECTFAEIENIEKIYKITNSQHNNQ